jgi:hypothetical protein
VPYKPTGQPAGRPRKDGTPPKPKGAREPRKGIGDVIPGQDRPFELAPCCPVCHPDGWPGGWTGYGCEHGIWARRA